MNETQICNMALSYLGQGPILNLLDPQTATEQLCALHYDASRDAVLEAHNWTFAIGRAVLSTPLVDTPAWGMAYAYQLPLDCVRVAWAGRQTDESAYDRFDWRVEGATLVTDQALVYIRYIRRIEDASKFSPLFVQALATRLAMEMCISITENVGLFERLAQQYAIKVGEAAANNGMQGRGQTLKQNVLANAR